jgi:micrococcal nuclease
MFCIFYLSVLVYAEQVKVVRVIDGDTFVIVPDIRVRLIGVDTPEIHPMQPYGLQAKAFVVDLFMRADSVRLEFDGKKYDKYKRRLALVYVTIDSAEVLVNAALLEQGLGRFESGYRYSKEMKQRFSAAQDAAKARNLNLWRMDNVSIKQTKKRNNPNRKGYTGNGNGHIKR